MICVAVSYRIVEGKESEALAMFHELAAATRREPGCRLYLLHRAASDPRTFFLYEQYDDQAALDGHRATEHFERLAKNGLWTITEDRNPVVGDLLDL